MVTVESYWRERASCLDIGSEVAGTLAVLEDQPETESDKGRSSWQGQHRRHYRRTVVQRCERHMRLVVVLVDQIWEVLVDPEDSGLADLVVAVAAVNTAEMAPVNRLISIFVPDNTHWLNLYP